MPADKRIKIRRGTAAEWATAETSAAQLAAGEVAWVDNDLVKGDGTTKVASLPRAGTGTYVPLLARPSSRIASTSGFASDTITTTLGAVS